MASIVYILCALTSFTCATLLIRGYRQSHTELLLWSSLSFVALAINNILLFLDTIIFPHFDLSVWRSLFAAVAGVLLLFGLIKEQMSRRVEA